MNRKPLVVIVGPTASGKSVLAMLMAKKYNGEIIAADSRTIYKEMNIGTAKPTASEQRRVRHHLIDIREPNQPFSAAEFKRLALVAVDDIHARGKLPILVGGTGLYVDAVIFDYEFGPIADPKYRQHLNRMSVEQLQDMCRQQHINMPINNRNKRHLVRAIELGGLIRQEKILRPNTIVVGMTSKRDKLSKRIERRIRQMIEDGVVEEVARIGKRYNWQGEALKGNIYRSFRGVAEGEKSIEEALRESMSFDLHLSKRQMTWFKRNPRIIWSEDPPAHIKAVDTFLNQQKG